MKDSGAMTEWMPKPNPAVDLRTLALSPEEGFVLSRLDGATPARNLPALTGLPPSGCGPSSPGSSPRARCCPRPPRARRHLSPLRLWPSSPSDGRPPRPPSPKQTSPCST
ncbi:hypothetical protein QEG98_39545 [Myxococcus sp. MxC21-1]|uniref:hypothetical protein n=1 Tax=Myxococcus sp. MxC21-1 TaxID=3041439 RepID=UPI00292FD491|nr:hypothetical protein [Myxococcus sp. MxC21-1]WNZ61868.1 hypothetical protein QEG98_39545 [Myxococcus sp. MxC21-1]